MLPISKNFKIDVSEQHAAKHLVQLLLGYSRKRASVKSDGMPHIIRASEIVEEESGGCRR
jgi:hypothetical protein